jgi:hypothetical protein
LRTSRRELARILTENVAAHQELERVIAQVMHGMLERFARVDRTLGIEPRVERLFLERQLASGGSSIPGYFRSDLARVSSEPSEVIGAARGGEQAQDHFLKYVGGDFRIINEFIHVRA